MPPRVFDTTEGVIDSSKASSQWGNQVDQKKHQKVVLRGRCLRENKIEIVISWGPYEHKSTKNMDVSILYLPQKFNRTYPSGQLFDVFFDRLGCPIGMRLWMNQWLPQLCQKFWGGLCILQYTNMGGFAPLIRILQNTQAPPEFLTTSILKQKP